MRTAIALVSFILVPTYAGAAFTDFSDYAQSQAFATDEVFESGDLSFKALNWLPITNPVKVFVVSPFSPQLNPGPGVEFLLTPGVREVSLSFNDGAGVLIAINGVEPIYPSLGEFTAGFGSLNGLSIGGVEVSTALTTDFTTYEVGTLTLRGPINSLAMAGLELFIDDILAQVPEPSAAALLALGVLGIRRRSRFRRS